MLPLCGSFLSQQFMESYSKLQDPQTKCILLMLISGELHSCFLQNFHIYLKVKVPGHWCSKSFFMFRTKSQINLATSSCLIKCTKSSDFIYRTCKKPTRFDQCPQCKLRSWVMWLPAVAGFQSILSLTAKLTSNIDFIQKLIGDLLLISCWGFSTGYCINANEIV